jgi:hypothetical protein
MRRMIDEPDLRAALAAAALQAGDDFRPEKRILLVENIYTQLLRNKGLV